MRVPLPLLALALAAGCGQRPDAAPVFPGAPVVLVSIDTLRADHLPAYGYSGVATPAIEALRGDSILFENAYSHCPLTLPSHVSLLTGLLPPAHGVRSNLGYRLDGAAHPTLARMLRAHGYATGAAVSAYVLRGATGIGDSFDLFDDAVGGGGEWTRDLSTLQRPGPETVHRAAAWMESVKGRPFFLFVHLYEPHAPYEPPEPFRARYGATYDGEIAASDGAVGELVASLRRAGLYDRAIVLLLSDHGEGLGDHGEQEHGMLLYREALHVPLLLKLPGSRRASTRVARPVGLVDVAPTIASLLKLAAPGALEGTSLLAGERSGSEAVYGETYYPRIHYGWSELRSLVDARHHYIDGPRPELYAIVQDPRESANTIARDGSVARSMKKDLDGRAAAFAGPGQVDTGAAEKLKALGYLSQAAPARDGDRPNPRDKIQVHEALKAAGRLGVQGRDEEALSALQRLDAKDRDCFEVQRELGGTLARLRRYEAAEAAYLEAIRLSPGLAGSVSLPLGLVELEMGRLDRAASRAEAARAEDPGHAHLLLARVALARRDLAAAEREARAAMADPAAQSEGAMALAQAHVQRSELPQALAVLEQARAGAIETGRAPAAGLDSLRADVLGRLGRFPEAEAVLREDIRAAPGRSQTYASLAVMVALQGRPRSEVHEILESMARANPSRETILLGAKTLEFVGDGGAAREWRKRLK